MKKFFLLYRGVCTDYNGKHVKGEKNMDFLSLERSVWQALREEKRPIVLYGMGDGADKIL